MSDGGSSDDSECQISILTIRGTTFKTPQTMLPHGSAFSHEPFDRFVDRRKRCLPQSVFKLNTFHIQEEDEKYIEKEEYIDLFLAGFSGYGQDVDRCFGSVVLREIGYDLRLFL